MERLRESFNEIVVRAPAFSKGHEALQEPASLWGEAARESVALFNLLLFLLILPGGFVDAGAIGAPAWEEDDEEGEKEEGLLHMRKDKLPHQEWPIQQNILNWRGGQNEASLGEVNP